MQTKQQVGWEGKSTQNSLLQEAVVQTVLSPPQIRQGSQIGSMGTGMIALAELFA